MKRYFHDSRPAGDRSRGVRAAGALLLIALATALLWFGTPATRAQETDADNSTLPTGDEVLVATLSGPIGPASTEYLRGLLEEATPNTTRALVLELDTPGGLVTSMRTMIQAILDARVPVLMYVSPRGSRAASAGTYLLYASHVAAMAPGTNLGAATPVAIGGFGNPDVPDVPDVPDDPDRPDENRDRTPEQSGDDQDDTGQQGDNLEEGISEPSGDTGDKARPPPPATATEAKVINDSVAYIRSLAELRGRNADWAEEAVRGAQSLTAGEAAKRDVIDLVADDVDDLLQRADGRTVELRGSEMALNLTDVSLERVEADWRIELLAFITNPNVALLLMAIGFYGIVFEFINPGALVPGTVGAISLLLGLYAFSALPLNLLGAGLLLLGLALMIGEAFLPSFGVLGIGGVAAFSLGATALFDTDAPGFQVAIPVVAGIAVGSLLVTLLIAHMAVRATRRKGVSGEQGLTGQIADVLDWSQKGGHVFVDGERWSAVSDVALEAPANVRVTGLRGNTLHVEPCASTDDTFKETPET